MRGLQYQYLQDIWAFDRKLFGPGHCVIQCALLCFLLMGMMMMMMVVGLKKKVIHERGNDESANCHGSRSVLPWKKSRLPVSSLLWPPGKRWTGRSTGQTSTDTNLMLDLLITILWPKNPQLKWNVTHHGSHISAWWVFPSGMSATQKSQGLVHKILQASPSHYFFLYLWTK